MNTQEIPHKFNYTRDTNVLVKPLLIAADLERKGIALLDVPKDGHPWMYISNYLGPTGRSRMRIINFLFQAHQFLPRRSYTLI